MLDKRTGLIAVIPALLFNLGQSFARNSDAETSAAENTRHRALKDTIFAKPYDQLPYFKVTKTKFRDKSKPSENLLLNDARRTLTDASDLLDEGRGQKLLQANGICFSGEWIIDQASEFSGLFKQSSRVPIIARASTSFSGTRQNERRALGLAVKLLPHDLGNSPSLNIFTLHTVGGVKTKHILDLSLDNEPPLGRIPRLQDIPTALRLKSDLLKADKEAGSTQPSVTFRTVGPLAAYGETKVNAPRWIRFSAAQDARIDKPDFRDELRVENYLNNQLIYRIEVGDHAEASKSKARWKTIGQLVLNQSVTSKVCDTRLHFPHPKN